LLSGLTLLTASSQAAFVAKRVFRKGASRAKLSVLNRMDIAVTTIYGIANFSIGFAKDNRRK
jgi:hypothetical protein